MPTDSLSTTSNETSVAVEPLAIDSALTIIVDSALVELPTKPKKVFDLESSPELNVGDELIIDGLNFYPGSHRTLPEAKPIMKKLLQMNQKTKQQMLFHFLVVIAKLKFLLSMKWLHRLKKSVLQL